MICIHGQTVNSHYFHSIEAVQYEFNNTDTFHLKFVMKEYQVKKTDIIRFQAFNNEGDLFLAIIGNQQGLGNLSENKDILVLVVDVSEMVSCLEILNEGK